LKGAYDRCFAQLGQAKWKEIHPDKGPKTVKKQQVFGHSKLFWMF
jgi:hypothetical protein